MKDMLTMVVCIAVLVFFAIGIITMIDRTLDQFGYIVTSVHE